ncbi:hypothetical protein Acr_05g0007910 [Actinidia rufa]|uniref:Uncharacterized protein n=1 Tax=Actinidia rufa TaxID=165716 RepID=A0A7J0ELH3_9ERIC|nr:hypothetical protein Acr_05g0007910 [Actinidia rufa]
MLMHSRTLTPSVVKGCKAHKGAKFPPSQRPLKVHNKGRQRLVGLRRWSTGFAGGFRTRSEAYELRRRSTRPGEVRSESNSSVRGSKTQNMSRRRSASLRLIYKLEGRRTRSKLHRRSSRPREVRSWSNSSKTCLFRRHAPSRLWIWRAPLCAYLMSPRLASGKALQCASPCLARTFCAIDNTVDT